MSEHQQSNEQVQNQAAVPNEAASQAAAGAWSSGRKAIAYQEARAVLQGQRATAQNIDKKGLRTTQFIIAMAGAFASLIKVLGVTIAPFWGYASVGFALIALTASLATYNTSRTVLGPDKAYLEWMSFHEFSNEEDPWEDQLLDEMGGWISQNTERIELNVYLLLASNAALLSAVVALVVGII